MKHRIRAAVLVSAVIAAVFAASTSLADAADHRNYMAVGDSITDGTGTSDWAQRADGTWERVAYRYSYPEQADIRGMGVGNSCVSDECAVAASRWLPQRLTALAYKPKTLVSNFGVNDLGQGMTVDGLISRSLKFRRDMKALGYRVVFSTLVPPPQGSPAAYIQAARLAFNDWVRTQPAYVDYAKALQCQQWLCPGLTNQNDMHVNDRGAAIMAGVLAGWVERDGG